MGDTPERPSFHPFPTRHWWPNESELRSFVIQEAEMDISEVDLVHPTHRLDSGLPFQRVADRY
jgi:hypothetical protein